MFVLREHTLGKELDVRVIGRQFRPDNGYPDVVKLMYDYDAAVADVMQTTYPDGRYFLSNEAISGNSDFLEVLSRKFDVIKAIFSVRFPPLQAISNYRYSGWITHSFQDSLFSSQTRPDKALERFEKKLEKFSGLVGRVTVCAIEGSRRFEERFCEDCFGSAPKILQHPPYTRPGHTNVSTGLAFANIMGRELRNHPEIEVLAHQRAIVVKALQNYDLPGHLSALILPELQDFYSETLIPTTRGYQNLLEKYGVSQSDAKEAAEISYKMMRSFLDRPLPNPAEIADLTEHALNIIDDLPSLLN